MITVHVVFNAHIDPVWLWPWQSGLDTLLATCRSACDKLDVHPDLHFTRGEAWAYTEIERIDPALFDRIRRHVDAGRWHVVGGWWIQPDCNGPGAAGFRKQIELGKAYFERAFGAFPRIAYNVDSFGHAATLPGFMHAAGQDRYVFMRPQEHEMSLPSRVFRWRGFEDGPEVVAFHIAGAYATRHITLDHVRASLAGMPVGIDHTMCLVGLGDHGGGPTERQIVWCREHANAIDGCRLVFSSPPLFFNAIADRVASLPLVVGELQHHAVGSYSVHRPVKVAVKRAEHRLVQAAVMRTRDPHPDAAGETALDDAWRWVCFGHFHDTYGGTCIPSAYEQVHAQLGYSFTVADEMLQRSLRRLAASLPDDRLQRIILFNASDGPYDGYAMHEPWLEGEPWQPHSRLLDEHGRVVPHQVMDPECLVPCDRPYFVRLLFRVRVEPGAMRVLRIDSACEHTQTAGAPLVEATTDRIATHGGTAASLLGDGALCFAGGESLPLPRLELVDDPTDTWTHEVNRYSDVVVARPVWTLTRTPDTGPLMASLLHSGRIGNSDVVGEYRVFAGEPYVEWLLRVYWNERHKLLKLTLPMPAPLESRWDGIAGGAIARSPDGKERPLQDRTLLALADGRRIGVVCPDVFALDATAAAVRFTLLRSPKMAHHVPFDDPDRRCVYADQGHHEFRFRFFCGDALTGGMLDRHSKMLNAPPLAADLTRGMPPL